MCWVAEDLVCDEVGLRYSVIIITVCGCGCVGAVVRLVPSVIIIQRGCASAWRAWTVEVEHGNEDCL